MRKVTSYKCPHCKEKYNSLKTWANHLYKNHPGVIPNDMTPAQFFYYLQTGKTSRACRVCKLPTKWNDVTYKYEVFCTNPKCKEVYRQEFKNRMMKVHGEVHLLNRPEQQRIMLLGKKNSGKYKFDDGTIIDYASTYELDFLIMLNRFLKFNGNDIMSPSPHTYYYNYVNPDDRENEGKKFYIPDFYIPSINLEIEIKQSTSTHPKILRIDKVKEMQKDKLMHSLKDVSYFKIMDKDYTEFFKFLENFQKKSIIELEESISPAIEASNRFTSISNTSNRLKLKDYKFVQFDKFSIINYKSIYKTIVSLIIREIAKMAKLRNIYGEMLIDKTDHPIGYFIIMDTSDSNIKWLKDLYILRDYRNRGLGYQLLNRAIRKYNITNVAVPIKNDIAVEMFLKANFIEYSRDESFLYLAIKKFK